MITNQDRADTAEAALDAFVMASTGKGLDAFPEERRDYAKDLMINLLHFLRLDCGLTPDEISAVITSTEINYESELAEEDED